MEDEETQSVVVRPVTNIKELESDVLSRPLDPETIDFFYGAIAFLKQQAKIVEKLLDERTEEFINENGSFLVGDIEYRVGEERDTKVINVKETLPKLYELFQGDEGRVSECLSANAFKPGAVKSFLKEIKQEKEFKNIFKVVTKNVIETGKPKKKVFKTNINFLPKGT